MPELPEVQTTVNGLKQILDRKIEDIWCDNKKMTKQDFGKFKEQVTGRTIENVKRRAKFIIIELSGGKTMLLHQRLTGHLLLGKWERKNGTWEANSEVLNKKVNGYIHLVFYLDNGQMLALSDLRKFATVEVWDSEELEEADRLQELGPEPLSEGFDLAAFKKALKGRRAAVKKILMDQKVVVGIGNIYSDEILWKAEVHPLTPVNELSDDQLRRILKAIKGTLREALEKRGTSSSDYRDIYGEKGHYHKELKAYHQHGEACPRCGEIIERIKVGGRSAHFCPKCQKEKT